ncbi:MAG: hypothetical protein RIR70_1364 [Pseudomonadota bacterium]|jgi:PPP family 3-phenylpropionic acid transporter
MLPYWRLSAHYFFYFAFIGTFSPYFGLYLASLGLSAFDIGVLMSLTQVMRLVAPNLWGLLASRLGCHVPIMRSAALASLAGFSSLYFTQGFAGLFVGLAVLAFFWTATLPLIETVTLAHLGAATARYGSIRLWGSIGFVVAVLGVGYLLDAARVTVLLPVLSVLLLGILGSSFFMPEVRVKPADEDGPRFLAILARAEVRRFLAASFFMSAAHGALYVFYSIYLVSQGYSKSLVGWLWTLGVLVEIGVFFYMPQLFKRFTLRAVLLFCFACAAVRFGLIGWCVAFLPVLVFAQVLHGATFGAHHACAMALINRWFGASHQARGQAIYGSISFGAGGMLGGMLSGWLWDAMGPQVTFTVGSIFGAIGLMLVWRMHREALS